MPIKLVTDKNSLNLLEELASRTVYGVFIDDTGSPGTIQNRNLHPDRKTWVAVIVNPIHIIDVIKQMPDALVELNKYVKTDEFHFTDIYSGKNDFKNVPVALRIELFNFMADVFSTYNFQILVQTFDPITMRKLHAMGILPEKVDSFDFTKIRDTALYWLLFRVKTHLQQNLIRNKAIVVIDEGFRENGAFIELQNFDMEFEYSSIFFRSSHQFYPIQLADFAAFCLNRMQWLMQKDELDEGDEAMLKICSKIAKCYINVEKAVLNLEKWNERFSHLPKS